MNKIDNGSVQITAMVVRLLGPYFNENYNLGLNCNHLLRTAIITGAMFDTETLSITNKKP